MSENFADAIISHSKAWADEAGVSSVDFTYGVLYGTRKQSNKKDWHIIRNIDDKLDATQMTIRPTKQWHCKFHNEGITVRVTIRIGIELWNYIAGVDTAFVELCIALIRACVTPSDVEPEDYTYTISDLKQIISLDPVPATYNVAILQRSQIEWLFFVARHFCDELVD